MATRLRCPTCRGIFKLPAGTTADTLSHCPICAAAFAASLDSETPETATPSLQGTCADANIDESDPRNPLPKLGIPLIVYGGAVVVLALAGLVHGASNLLFVTGAAAVGLVFLARGLIFVLQPLFWPPRAPLGILGNYGHISPVLYRLRNDRSYLGTYQPPHGLFQLLTRLVAPQFNYLTPPIRPLFSSAGAYALALVASLPACIGLIAIGLPLAGIVLPAACLAGFAALIVAVYLCNPRVPPMPQVEPISLPTLTKAGNPKALVNAIVERKLYALRDGDGNRRFSHTASDTGRQQRVTEFDGDVSFESLPMLVPLSDGISLAATLLNWAGVGISLAGWALVVLAPMTERQVLNKLAAFAPVVVGWFILQSAYKLQMTFRFRSVLAAVRIKGTVHGQSAGGEGAGFGTIERFHSELHATITATEVLTECTTATLGRDLAIGPPEVLPAERHFRGALASPRYILEATWSERVGEKVLMLETTLLDYRDSHGEVMGADEESGGARSAIAAKLTREKEQALLQHQLQIQADMQRQLFGKLLKDMKPEELKRAAATIGAGSAIPRALSVSKVTPADGEKLIRHAIRAYLTPGQSPDAKAANKRMVEELCNQFQIPSHRLQELRQIVKTEMGI